MLQEITKTMNFNSTSVIGDKNVMFMYGAVNAEGLPSWNSNIADMTLYLAHKNEVDEDFKAFQEAIINSL